MFIPILDEVRKRKISYLLRDEFITALAAGSVNGTKAEPGPGTRAVVDTGGDALSIAGGKLTFANPNSTWGDPGYWLDAVTRTAGRLIVTSFTSSTLGSGPEFGFDNDQSGKISSTTGDGVNINTASTLFSVAGTSINIGTATAGTAYQWAVVLRSAGAYIFVKGGAFTNWTLLWFDASGTAATLYPIHSNYDSNAFTVDYVRVPRDLWLPTPLAYDTFTRSNGALGNSETSGPDSQSTPARAWQSGGSTWAIASNEAVNTPTQGAELLSNIGFETAGGGGADVFANWTESTSGTSTINDEGAVVHGGSHACRMDVDASNSNVYVNQDNHVNGTWYEATAWIRSASGTPSCYIGPATPLPSDITVSTTYTQYRRIYRAVNTNTFLLKRSAAASNSLYFDDISLKVLTLNTLFSSVETYTANVVAQVECDTVVADTQAGMVLNLDSVSAPANFVIAYHDGTNAKLDKCVAGTYTSVISAAAYAAGANLVVVKSGTSYSLYYNNAQVGSTSTISDAGIISNTLHGMFSTYSGNQLDNFQVFPRGTNNEYSGLNAF